MIPSIKAVAPSPNHPSMLRGATPGARHDNSIRAEGEDALRVVDELDEQERPGLGLQRQPAPPRTTAPRPSAGPTRGEDPAGEAARQIARKHAVHAEAAVLKNGDRMVGTLLNVVA